MNSKRIMKIVSIIAVLVLAASMLAACGGSGEKADDGTVKITNVSYDPTRELYVAYNEWFAPLYEEETGTKVEIVQSHGGSGG